MDEEEVVIPDTTNETEETVETDTTEVVEPEQDLTVEVEQLQATNKKLFERAKKAEADLKALKGTTQQASPLNVEEAVLLANGMPDDLMMELKAVAKVRGINLLKAQNDPIFIAVKEKFEKDKKQQDASLPASRGSGAQRVQKNPLTPGLTREEHMAMAKAAL